MLKFSNFENVDYSNKFVHKNQKCTNLCKTKQDKMLYTSVDRFLLNIHMRQI